MSVFLATLLCPEPPLRQQRDRRDAGGRDELLAHCGARLGDQPVVSLLSFVVNETIVPETNAESRRIMVEEVRGGTLPTVTRHVVIKGERGNDLDWILYANRYDSRTSTFHQATLVYMQQRAGADRVCRSHRLAR